MKNYSFLQIYILFIVLIKIYFLFLVFHSLLIKHLLKKNPDNINYKTLSEKIKGRKDKVEFIFTISMACLLIYLFNPNRKNHLFIDDHIKLILYFFGFLLIITADWGSFINF